MRVSGLTVRGSPSEGPGGSAPSRHRTARPRRRRGPRPVALRDLREQDGAIRAVVPTRPLAHVGGERRDRRELRPLDHRRLADGRGRPDRRTCRVLVGRPAAPPHAAARARLHRWWCRSRCGRQPSGHVWSSPVPSAVVGECEEVEPDSPGPGTPGRAMRGPAAERLQICAR